MIQIEFSDKVKEFFTSSKVRRIFAFFSFTIVLTLIIASQNFFFQNIIENGISKREVIAQKTLTVIDVKRTEQHKKEVSQRVEPVLTPAEDDFIKTNLLTLQNSIHQIRKKNVDYSIKSDEIGILFELSGNSNKSFIVNFLLKADEASLNEAFEKATLSLANILRAGITEKDYEKGNIDRIIMANMVPNVSKRQVAVITAMLEQVIVPNLVVDEFATEIERKNAQNSVKPYEVVFQKGDKILFEGEPVTRLKRDALRQAGYNVYELNWSGLIAIYIIVFIGTLLFLAYMKFFEKEFLESRYLAIVASLAILLVAIAVLLPTGVSPYILPFPAFIILTAIFTKPRISFVANVLLLSVMAIGFQYNIQYIVTFLLLSLIAVTAISQIRYAERVDLIKTGFNIGVAGLVIVSSIYILEKCLIDVSSVLILKIVYIYS